MAFMNRWRGGGWPYLPGEVHGGENDHKRTQVRRIGFSLAAGLLAWNPWVGLIFFLSTLTGWGYPASVAIGSKTTQVEPEFMPFDYIACAVSRHPRIYGLVWLTLHGLTTGIILAVITHETSYLMLGTMGVSYILSKDWERAEIVYGAIVGVVIAFSLHY